MQDSDFDTALGLDEAPPASGTPQGTPGDKATANPEKPAENPNSAGESNPTGTTAPSAALENGPAGENKGALAKEMEPFKTLLESKKWDPTKPEFGPSVLKSYQEVEARASRSDTAAKQTAIRADQIAAVLEGDVEGINKIRQSRGLGPIAAQKPLAERKQELDGLIGNLQKVLDGKDQDGSAFAALNKYLTDNQDSIRLEEKDVARNPGKTREEVFEGRKATVQAVLGSLFQENKDAQAHVDQLTSHFDPGGLFYALGIDILDAFKTPELARGFAKLGQALHVLENLDKVVGDRVGAEVERRRAAENGGPDGGQPQGTTTQGIEDLDPVSKLFLD